MRYKNSIQSFRNLSQLNDSLTTITNRMLGDPEETGQPRGNSETLVEKANSSSNKRSLRILVADDSQFNLRSFENILRKNMAEKY